MRVWPLTWTSWPEAPLRNALLPDGLGEVLAADAGLPHAASANAATAISGRKRFITMSPSLRAEGFDRREPCRPQRGINPKYESDGDGDGNRDQHWKRSDGHRDVGGTRDYVAGGQPGADAQEAAHGGEHSSFDHELQEEVAGSSAECFAQAA